MKRFTLLILMVALFSVSYGQRIKADLKKASPYGSEVITPLAQPAASSLKTGGDIFFRETFNWKDESATLGWSLPAGWQIVEETDFGCPFIWRAGTDSIKGKLTFEPGHTYSLSPEDGYLVLPMDEYNYRDNIMTANEATAYIQLPPIDCSAYPGVILTFRQNFRLYYTPNVKVAVSNDLGTHWAFYDVSYETGTNVFCKNPFPEVNISEVAAGMSNIWIRFVWTAMSRYFWCIDDLQLMESYNHDLKLENSWQYMADLDPEDNDEGFCYMIPSSQVGVNNFGSYTFAGAFLNAGLNDMEGCNLKAEVFKNGVLSYTQTSDPGDIWTIERDTFPVTTMFNPEGYGAYKIVLTAQADQTEERPVDNSYTDTFYVTDSIYSFSDWEFEEHSSTAAWGNNDGDYLGIACDITTACEVNSISCMIMQRPRNPRASTQVGYGFQYWVFKYSEEEAAWVEQVSSDFMDVTQEMINTWVTLPMSKDGESEFIEPGFYIAAIQVFHNGGAGADNSVYRFTIGADQGHRYSYGKTVYRTYDGTDWGGCDEMNMIRLNINQTGAPTTADVVFNVDMKLQTANGLFHPTSDNVDVTGTFNSWGSTQMTDADGDGIYTVTVPGMTMFEKFEYKYRINGTLSEFPTTGKNRNYRVSYYNMVEDVFNNGIGMGINASELDASVSVYPNPGQGLFHLTVTSPQIADLNVRVTDIKGQVVYNKLYQNSAQLNETIDLTSLAKGIYFLKVNNTVKKIIVE